MEKSPHVRKEVLGYPAPERAYDTKYADAKCPFTGGLAVKNELLRGVVVKKDITKTATIEWYRSVAVPKYERQETRRSRLRVHNPPAFDAQIGDEVVVAKTRPLSKTKHHVIIAIIGKGKLRPGAQERRPESYEEEKKKTGKKGDGKSERSGKSEGRTERSEKTEQSGAEA